jgi:hypothetical protein
MESCKTNNVSEFDICDEAFPLPVPQTVLEGLKDNITNYPADSVEGRMRARSYLLLII